MGELPSNDATKMYKSEFRRDLTEISPFILFLSQFLIVLVNRLDVTAGVERATRPKLLFVHLGRWLHPFILQMLVRRPTI